MLDRTYVVLAGSILVRKHLDVPAHHLVIVLAQFALCGVELLRYGEQSVDHRRTSSDNIAPVHVNHGRFREEIEVLAKFVNVGDSSGRAVRTTLVIRKSHDVLRLLFLGFSGEVSGTSSDVLGDLGEKRNNIQVRIIEHWVLSILGIDSA